MVETHQYEYRYLFEEAETENTTWDHPHPDCDASLWAALSQPPYEPKFEALSYTWGSADDPEIAFVEYTRTKAGLLADIGTLPIGHNLATALRHLRLPDKSRTLWVDAVCINQEDLTEREDQVKRMASIYKLAQRVVVWLGPSSGDSDTAFSYLDYLGSQLEVSRNRYRYRAPGATEPEWFRSICPIPFSDKVWTAIDRLLQRPWFERLWVWQEIQLANSRAIAVCGHRTMLWQNLRKAIIALLTKDELPTISLRRRLQSVENVTTEMNSCTFGTLIGYSRERHCSDPRDKIYGMLSFCGQQLAERIEVSYTKDVAEVYKDVFLQSSLQNRRLDSLPGCTSTRQRPGSPSWVPNWEVAGETYPLGAFCCASGISSAVLEYTAPRVLQVAGVQAARVHTVTQRATAHLPDRDVLDAIRSWEPPGLQEDSYVSGGLLIDAYCTTLRAGYLSERWSGLSAPSLESWKELYLSQVSSTTTKHGDNDYGSDGDIDWMLRIVRGRTLMRTEEGHIGIGPSEAEPGKRSTQGTHRDKD